jgi:hypothetical protein
MPELTNDAATAANRTTTRPNLSDSGREVSADTKPRCVLLIVFNVHDTVAEFAGRCIIAGHNRRHCEGYSECALPGDGVTATADQHDV